VRTYHWSAMDVVQVREYQLQEICTSPGAYVVLTRQLRSDIQELCLSKGQQQEFFFYCYLQ
jgi:hypothetical protein